MGNLCDLALDAAKPSMILRVHHDYPLSLCMCICTYGNQRGRAGTPLAFAFLRPGLCRLWDERQRTGNFVVLSFATGFLLFNHQAELR